MSAVLTDTWWLTGRRLKAGMSQPAYVIVSLVQPVIWLFLFGNLFRRVVELPGFGTSSYLDYLIPGVVMMNALSVNMWAGMVTLEEIERGTLNRFLVLPVSRSAIMNSNVVEQAVNTSFQSAVIVLLGWAAGANYPGEIAGMAVLIGGSVLVGTIFGAFSNAIGMLVRQRESIIGINTFLLLPLTFLSTVFMVRELMPGWMQGISRANPLDWAVVAGRSALSADPDWGLVASRGGWLLLLALIAVALSTRTFRAYQKAV
ncbi:MAG TPA: ABC transporter permease [Natronosporangium sp.]